jgi:hypothetical protein
MNRQNSKIAVVKQRAIHEFKDLMRVASYLAFFFCAITTYTNVLLHNFRDWHLNYGFAIINALVITKVIWIGEVAHLGKGQESRPLVILAIYKAFLFTLLVLAFHILEELIKHLLHHEPLAHTVQADQLHIMFARGLIVFAVFIPLFVARELGRVMGEDKFYGLLFSRGATYQDAHGAGDSLQRPA